MTSVSGIATHYDFEKLTPSALLAAIVGPAPLTRIEAITRAVLKAKSCQLCEAAFSSEDPRASYDCDCDPELFALTGKTTITLFALCSCVIHNLR